MEEPKVFISYSWTDQSHQELVKHWADRLVADGIEVILDIYDLKEGDDKYAFMESMVTDPSVTHVLVICDGKYVEKASARKAGVGTESQIISGEVYAKVKQSKFIPIVCEFGDDGEPILPTFMKSRMWINFSSSEAENENWEQLVRLLYGKPQHTKPVKGKAPTYITSDAPVPTSEALAKFNSLKQAILQNKKGIGHYRRDFIESCIKYADKLRVRDRPSVESIGKKVLEDCGKLKAIRDHLCDWILLEGEITDSEEFSEAVIDVLERLRELKSRPPEVNSWNETWFEAHAVFVYETFLYIIASLIKSGAYPVLHEIYSSNYLRPSTDRYGKTHFEKFGCFYGYSEALQSVLSSEGVKLYAPAAELIKRQADREDLPFADILQAELLTLLMFFITPDTHWYPQTLHYSLHGSSYPFFVRAAQHKHFNKLSIITGIKSADDLRSKVKDGHERVGVSRWYDFHFERNFWSAMNMDNLDTLT
ncbi:toll/interleukin-1 receptor domain-containing protein [Pseudomonas cichorii]|uniref:SEFIR domain protein n=1 Tax=Pseudomonas cichorii TaxID=36746 RepID=A0A3M4VY96_PSECI|nr:toll/interleukin-1 receptor domain-containing protein [Pseudomonas cichorii]RMR56700.1 SEFIR domain protein [Pseudomonas cichorii]